MDAHMRIRIREIRGVVPMSRNARGVALALIGGIGWGFSGACAQFLFSAYGLNAVWLTVVRMLCAGVLLLVVVLATKREQLVRMVKTPKAVGRLLVFAVFGLMLCQFTYLEAIQYSNAGTATVLEYIGPVLIVAATCLSCHRLPRAKEIAAMLCVVVGTFLLATHGNPGTLVLSPRALFWGLAAAVTVAIYTIAPGSLMKTYGSLPVVACGMLIGGAVLGIATQAWAAAPTFGEGGLDTVGVAVLLAGLVLVGTAIGFSAYLQAVADIGAAKASLIASVETVSATAFAVLWLGTSFEPVDFVGFVFIMATVFLLANFKGEPVESE